MFHLTTVPLVVEKSRESFPHGDLVLTSHHELTTCSTYIHRLIFLLTLWGRESVGTAFAAHWPAKSPNNQDKLSRKTNNYATQQKQRTNQITLKFVP
jgi:hypothetical protein